MRRRALRISRVVFRADGMSLSPKGGALRTQHTGQLTGPFYALLSRRVAGATVALVAAKGDLGQVFVLGDLGLDVHVASPHGYGFGNVKSW